MNVCIKLLLALLLVVSLDCQLAFAKHKASGKKPPSKKPSGGAKGPYGVVPTKKSLNNRSCRATWTCGETKCIGVDDQWLSGCKGSKNCKEDLKSWVLTAAKSQWGNTATHYKAVNNINKPKNCAKFVKKYPELVKDIKSCIKSFGQSGSNYKVKFNDLCDVISKTCTVSTYGVKETGFPERTMVISVADQAKCTQSGVEDCRSYHRALCINGKVYDGYISTKKH